MEHEDNSSCGGNSKELTHEMDRYSWNIICPLREMEELLVKEQQRKDTRFSAVQARPVETRINPSVALDSFITRTS